MYNIIINKYAYGFSFIYLGSKALCKPLSQCHAQSLFSHRCQSTHRLSHGVACEVFLSNGFAKGFAKGLAPVPPSPLLWRRAAFPRYGNI